MYILNLPIVPFEFTYEGGIQSHAKVSICSRCITVFGIPEITNVYESYVYTVSYTPRACPKRGMMSGTRLPYRSPYIPMSSVTTADGNENSTV